MKKVLALILTLAVCLTFLAACGNDPAGSNQPQTDNKVYELNVNFSHPESSAETQVAMLNKISELSNGRLKFNYYYSSSLIGVSEIVKSLGDGTVDVSSVPMLIFPDQLVYSGQIMSMPLLGIDSVEDATNFFGELYNKFPCIQQEMEGLGMKLVSWYAMNGYQLHYTHSTTNRVPTDFAGSKLLCDNTMITQLLAKQNVAVTAAPSSEMYSHLEKGVGEAIFLNYTNINNYGLSELIDATLEFGTGGINYNVFLICFSQKTWDQLPADLQELIMSVQEEWLAGEIERNIRSEDAARSVLDAQSGYERIQLTDEEIAAWEAAILPMHDEYIKDLEDRGYTEARAIYDYIVEHFQG